MPVNWTAFQQRVDFIVDGTLADPVILIPWISGTQVYTPSEQVPDLTRKLRVTTGIFVTPGAKLVGESGSAVGSGGKEVAQEAWLSITTANLGGDITYWQSGDRVYFPNLNRFYNLSYIDDSATFRPNLHLIRENDIASGEGSPIGQAAPTMVNILFFDTLGNKLYRSVSLTPPNFTNKDWVKM